MARDPLVNLVGSALRLPLRGAMDIKFWKGEAKDLISTKRPSKDYFHVIIVELYKKSDQYRPRSKFGSLPQIALYLTTSFGIGPPVVISGSIQQSSILKYLYPALANPELAKVSVTLSIYRSYSGCVITDIFFELRLIDLGQITSKCIPTVPTLRSNNGWGCPIIDEYHGGSENGCRGGVTTQCFEEIYFEVFGRNTIYEKDNNKQ